MPGYKAYGNNTLVSTPGDSCISIVGITATLRQSRTSAITFSVEGTPDDQVLNWTVQRCTAEGTATGLAPTRNDLADAESGMNVGVNHTGEPTYTATEILPKFSLNTRATFRWIAMSSAHELVTPATNDAGYGIVAFHASITLVYGAQIEFTD